jgi:hypothetical protein
MLGWLFCNVWKNDDSLSKMNAMVSLVVESRTITLDGDSVRELFALALKIFLKRSFIDGFGLKESTEDNFAFVETLLLQVIQTKGAKRSPGTTSHFERKSDLFTTSRFLASNNTRSLSILPKFSSPPSNKGLQMQSTMVDSLLTASEPHDRVNCEHADISDSAFDGGAMLEAIVGRQLTFMVDQVDLYVTRMATLRTLYSYTNEFLAAAATVPLMVIPKPNESAPNQYKTAIKVVLKNENCYSSGIYGWCFSCRKTADFYCKDTRVPICGLECKARVCCILNDPADSLRSELTPLNSQRTISEQKDSCQNTQILAIMQYLFDITTTEIGMPQQSDLVISTLADCILILLDKTSPEFSTTLEFNEQLKFNLVKIVGSFLLLSSPKLTRKATSIIQTLFRKYRHYLKAELYALLEGVILKVLDGVFLTTDERSAIQGLLFSILSDRQIIADLFLNYDCQLGYGDVLDHCFRYIGTFL